MELKSITSKSGTFLIYKHSPICPVSEYTLNEISQFKESIPVIQINVLSQKELSQKIAKYYNIEHESPQIILIKNQKPIKTLSHYDITLENLKKLDY
jgi:bacillithiol system protein YtxJ